MDYSIVVYRFSSGFIEVVLVLVASDYNLYV